MTAWQRAPELASPFTSTLDANAAPMARYDTRSPILLTLLFALAGRCGPRTSRRLPPRPATPSHRGVQNPELSLESRVSESGTITYPLIGAVAIGGNRCRRADVAAVKAGGRQNPRSSCWCESRRQVSVLGQVGPLPFPRKPNTGSARCWPRPAASRRAGPIPDPDRRARRQALRLEIDAGVLMNGASATISWSGRRHRVHRAPRSISTARSSVGSYRLERDMTLRHAWPTAASAAAPARHPHPSPRCAGKIVVVEPVRTTPSAFDDVIYADKLF